VSADLINGGTMVAAAVIALFFFRHWKLTRDRLYLMFAAGFLTFALSRAILSFLDEDDEGRVFVYALRLLAFALILAAIIDKNRSQAPPVAHSQNGSRPQPEATRARLPTSG
jgi:hypothetical protein